MTASDTFACVASVGSFNAPDGTTVVIRPKLAAGVITLNFDSRDATIAFCRVILAQIQPAVKEDAAVPLPVETELDNDSHTTLGLQAKEEVQDKDEDDLFDIPAKEMARVNLNDNHNNDSDTNDSFEDTYGVSQELW